MANPVRLIRRVNPLGQVALRAAWSTVKSSMVNPPAMTRRFGAGLTRSIWPLVGQFSAEIPCNRKQSQPTPSPANSRFRAARRPTAASWLSAPLALVSAQSVMMPVSGSTAKCAL